MVGCQWLLLSALSGRGFVSRLDVKEPGIGLQGFCILILSWQRGLEVGQGCHSFDEPCILEDISK